MIRPARLTPNFQWAMIGLIGIIFVLIPETPWWLASKGKLDKATKVLQMCNGGIEGYDIQEHIVSLSLNSHLDTCSPVLTQLQEVMTATVAIERQNAELNQEVGMWAVFQGRNLLRFLIAGWPKIAQQFVGLAVFNTYATYFCK